MNGTSAGRNGSAWGIIVAAGRSERMGGSDKVFASVMGRPLLAWPLRAFERCDSIDAVVIVAAADRIARVEALAREWRFAKVKTVVGGGEHRQDSVRAGLEAATDAGIVAIHDGARPLVTSELIAAGIALARVEGAALCAFPSRDTVKEVAAGERVVTGTIDRDRAWLAQTPQCFDRSLLLEAHRRAGANATDDAALVEAMDHPVHVYVGDASNLKVTSPEDLIVVEALLRARFGQT